MEKLWAPWTRRYPSDKAITALPTCNLRFFDVANWFRHPFHNMYLILMLHNLDEDDTLIFARQSEDVAEVVESADTRCSGRREQ